MPSDSDNGRHLDDNGHNQTADSSPAHGIPSTADMVIEQGQRGAALPREMMTAPTEAADILARTDWTLEDVMRKRRIIARRQMALTGRVDHDGVDWFELAGRISVNREGRLEGLSAVIGDPRALRDRTHRSTFSKRGRNLDGTEAVH